MILSILAVVVAAVVGRFTAQVGTIGNDHRVYPNAEWEI